MFHVAAAAVSQLGVLRGRFHDVLFSPDFIYWRLLYMTRQRFRTSAVKQAAFGAACQASILNDVDLVCFCFAFADGSIRDARLLSVYTRIFI
jgi:hypothetical protein